MSYEQQEHQQQGNPNDQQQTPWHISEANSDCLHVFEKLKLQREQCRFTDLFLIVQGRNFPAHRCVLAACSPWFDARLKVHKSTREHMAIDQCKDYEIFYALLTYIYTGNINIDGHNVAELLSLSVLFQMNKLKSYCCEYLSRNLHAKTVHTAVDLAIRHNLIDLIRRCFGYLHSSFRYLFQYERQELMQYSPQVVQAFLSDKGFFLPPMLVLSFSTAWVNYDLSSREECFGSLVYYIDWSKISNNANSNGNGSLLPLLIEHLNDDQLYQNSPESLFNILRILDSKHIYLGRGFQEKYQRLQDQMLLEQDLDELNDSNSFLSMAINSAVKDLEHSEVDTNFFLENDPFRPPAPAPEQHQQSMGPPPPPPSQALMPPQVPSQQQQQQQPLGSVPVPPSSSSIMQQPIQSHHQYSYSNSNTSSIATSSSNTQTHKPESKLNEKFKDSFEFEIVEQLINEQQQSEQEKNKYTSTKRYDPKYRALNEAFRQMEDMQQQQPDQPPPPSSPPPQPPSRSIQQSKYPLPKQRHLSSSEQSQSPHQPRQGMHNLPQRVAYDVSLNPLKVMALNPLERGASPEEQQPVWHSATVEDPPSKSIQEQADHPDPDALQSTSPPASPFTHLPASPGTPPPTGTPMASTSSSSSLTTKALSTVSPSTTSNIASNSALADSAAITAAKEFPVQKKLASKERRAKAVAMMEENANATLDPKPAGLELSAQKQHVRKAKLLAEHRETLQRTHSQAESSVDDVKLEIKKEDQVLIGTSQEATIQSNNGSVNEKLHGGAKTRSREKKKGNLHRCPICGHSSKTKMSLYKHLSDAHMLQPPFRCMQTGCSFETSKLQILLNHDNVHSKETLFHCPAEGCDFKATTMHRMKFHKILHSDKVFHCHKCDKKFNHKSSLNTHLLVHETAKRLNCPSCDFSTKYKNHLSTHMRIHTGDVLKCSVDPLCTYTTPKKSLMTAHVRAHKKERPFKCDLCSKAFVENSALTRHKRIHSDELPFACTLCTFKTRRRDKLKHHLLKKHPNGTQTASTVGQERR